MTAVEWTPEVIGARIRDLRERAGWSQADLANALSAQGLPFYQQTVYKLEHGQRALRLHELPHMAEVLSASFDEITPSWSAARGGDIYAAGVRDGLHRAIQAIVKESGQ